MKMFLSYLVKFLENSTMVSKKYPSDYAMGKSEKRPVIMIIHDKSTFSTYNKWKKI